LSQSVECHVTIITTVLFRQSTTMFRLNLVAKAPRKRRRGDADLQVVEPSAKSSRREDPSPSLSQPAVFQHIIYNAGSTSAALSVTHRRYKQNESRVKLPTVLDEALYGAGLYSIDPIGNDANFEFPHPEEEEENLADLSDQTVVCDAQPRKKYNSVGSEISLIHILILTTGSH
jgi:hypothetical protein